MHISIPGYMVWAAALYALLGSFVIQRFGKPLVAINYQKQRVEANFRFFLIRVRENAEQIALYKGAEVERTHSRTAFQAIYDNWRAIMTYTKRLTIVNAVYAQIAIIFPTLVASPAYFAGAYPIGTLFQIGDAFGTVSDSFSWFINSFTTLANWRATVNRLREFVRSIDEQHTREAMSRRQNMVGSNRHMVDADALQTHKLMLALPNGAPLAKIGSLKIAPGARRARARRIGFGQEHPAARARRALAVRRGSDRCARLGQGPVRAQISYIPIDTLKAALAYPSEVTEFTDDAYRAAPCARSSSATMWIGSRSAHWTHRMSPGEQQRLAAARVLLQKPDFVFLDEGDQLARFGDRAAPLRNDAAGIAAGRDRQRRAPRFARYLSLGDDPTSSARRTESPRFGFASFQT